MEKPARREWVKNAAIIFLVILLILTFFSNTIMNRSLPEVATVLAERGTITAQVRGTGTVKSDGEYSVKAPSTREIRSVLVKVGQQISAGDILFVLGSGDSEELKTAEETLYTLQMSYQRTALSLEAYDYTREERELQKAKDTLEQAKLTLEAAEKALQESIDDLDPAAKQEVLDKQTELEKTKELLAGLTEARQAQIVEAENQVTAALEEYNTAKDELAAADPETMTEEELQALTDKVNDLELALEQSKNHYADLVSTDDPAISAAQAKADRLQEEYDRLLAQNQINQAQNQEAYEAAKRALADAQETYDTLDYNLKKQKEADRRSSALAGMELGEISRQIQKQKALIAELSGGEENTITANVSGTVSAINVTAGNTPVKGDVLCVVEVPDLGYSMSFNCTTDQAKRLHVGDTATVSNYYWGNQIVATLTGIATDPQNPQTGRILSFSLEGSVSTGSQLTISVGSKSATYDTVIPNSAIRSDSNGSFVLVVTAKSSPLGNRYFANRVAVEVLASDDNYSAVTGGLNSGDYVITTSNKPITAGTQVRLAEG